MLLAKLITLSSLSILAAAQLGGLLGGILGGGGGLGGILGGGGGGLPGLGGIGGIVSTVTSDIGLPTGVPSPPPLGSCNTGSQQCCNNIQSSTNQAVAQLAGLLGLNLQGLNVPIGIDCSPISVIGIGGGSGCSANPVCCDNVQFNGLISVGCNPISL